MVKKKKIVVGGILLFSAFVAAVFLGSCTELAYESVVVMPTMMPGAKFVGAEACSGCHEKESRYFKLSDHARVCGEVVAWRGNWGWAYLQAPSSWWQQAVTIEDGKVQLCDEQQAHYDQVIYTRGGSGVPRGMLLGTFGDRSFVPSANLDVWLAPQSTGDLRQ